MNKITKLVALPILLSISTFANADEFTSFYKLNSETQTIHFNTVQNFSGQIAAYECLENSLKELLKDDYPNIVLTIASNTGGWLLPETYQNLQNVRFCNHWYMQKLADSNDVQPTDEAYEILEKPMSNVGLDTRSKLNLVTESLVNLRKIRQEYKNKYDECSRKIKYNLQEVC